MQLIRKIALLFPVLVLFGCSSYEAIKPSSINITIAGQQLPQSEIISVNHCGGGFLGFNNEFYLYSSKCTLIETNDKFILVDNTNWLVGIEPVKIGVIIKSDIKEIGMYKFGLGRQIHIRVSNKKTFVFQIQRNYTFVDTSATDRLYDNLKSKGYPEFDVDKMLIPKVTTSVMPIFLFKK